MQSDFIIENINQLLNIVLESEKEYFCTDIRIKPINNIRVYIDGDFGITIEKCVHINRKLYSLIEESALFPTGDFSLEVSSPGIDEPLRLQRQYFKNIGRNIEIIFLDGERKEGKLMNVTESDILIEFVEGKGKKSTTQLLLISFSNIMKATIQIKF